MVIGWACRSARSRWPELVAANLIAGLPFVWRPSRTGNVAEQKTILLLHGTGADENDLLGLGAALDANANLISPRAQVRAAMPPVGDGMIRWFMRNQDGTFDEDGIVRVTQQLADFLALAAAELGFDPSNVWVAGFSNGANAAGALLLTHPDAIRGVMAFGTTKSFVVTPAKPDLTGKRIWICNGALDGYSPAERTRAMVDEFTELGAEVSLLMHGGGHTISHEHVREVAAELLEA